MNNVLDVIINPTITFDEIFAAIGAFFMTFITDPGVLGLWDGFASAIGVVLPYMPFILLAFYLVVTFFGKKLFSLLRFLTFFVAGYALGVLLLAPQVLAMMPAIPDWAIGVAAGLIAAILSKFLYFITIVVAVGYSVYMAIFQGLIFPEVMSFATGNALISLGFAAVAVILVLVLRKYIEMLATATLGAWGIATLIPTWWNYNELEFLVGQEWLGTLIVTAVIALVGFVVQFKTRSRY